MGLQAGTTAPHDLGSCRESTYPVCHHFFTFASEGCTQHLPRCDLQASPPPCQWGQLSGGDQQSATVGKVTFI